LINVLVNNRTQNYLDRYLYTYKNSINTGYRRIIMVALTIEKAMWKSNIQIKCPDGEVIETTPEQLSILVKIFQESVNEEGQTNSKTR